MVKRKNTEKEDSLGLSVALGVPFRLGIAIGLVVGPEFGLSVGMYLHKIRK